MAAAVDVPDPYLHHVNEAWHQLAAGRRPTADSVLDVVRGSKATAVAAMQFFWSTYVPGIVSGRTLEDVPDPVARLAGQIWSKAVRLATDRAQADFASDRDALNKATHALENEREAIEQRHKTALAALALELKDKHQKAMDDLRSKLEAALAEEKSKVDAGYRENGGLRKLIDELRTSVQSEKDRNRETEQTAKDESAKVITITERLRKAEKEIAALKDASKTLALEVRVAKDALAAESTDHREHIEALTSKHEAALERQRNDHAAELERLSQLHAAAEMRLKLDIDALKVQVKKKSEPSKPARTRARNSG